MGVFRDEYRRLSELNRSGATQEELEEEARKSLERIENEED